MKKVLLLMTVIAMFVISCGGKKEAPSNVIKIGYAGPLTGDTAQYGVAVEAGLRMKIEEIGDGIFRVTARYGFKDEPDVRKILESCKSKGMSITNDVTFFLGREILISTDRPGMAIWREQLFSFMSRNSQRATTFYRVPSEQVFEVGIQVEI